MERVYTLQEAEEWFLSHSSGTVFCVKNVEGSDTPDKVLEVSSYKEAVEFFKG